MRVSLSVFPYSDPLTEISWSALAAVAPTSILSPVSFPLLLPGVIADATTNHRGLLSSAGLPPRHFGGASCPYYALVSLLIAPIAKGVKTQLIPASAYCYKLDGLNFQEQHCFEPYRKREEEAVKSHQAYKRTGRRHRKSIGTRTGVLCDTANDRRLQRRDQRAYGGNH